MVHLKTKGIVDKHNLNKGACNMIGEIVRWQMRHEDTVKALIEIWLDENISQLLVTLTRIMEFLN